MQKIRAYLKRPDLCAAAAAIFATPPPPTVRSRRAAADDISVPAVLYQTVQCGHVCQQNSISVHCLCVGLIFGQNVTYFFSCVAIWHRQLSLLAKAILAVRATGEPSERVFLIAGLICRQSAQVCLETIWTKLYLFMIMASYLKN